MIEFPTEKMSKYFAVIFSTIILCACNPYPSDSNKFKNIVTSWRLEQLTQQEASALLTAKGFKVTRHKPGKNIIDQGNYIEATQSAVTNIICITDWRVTLMLVHEKISEIRSSASYTCS